MLFWIAITAAIGCAFCNGIAAVLQKISADKEAQATTLQASLFFKLLQDWPYLIGIALDGMAWVLTLIAVHSLPLFVVQPIVAFGVVVTALVERFAFKRKLSVQSIAAIGVTVLGLLLLATAAAPEALGATEGSPNDPPHPFDPSNSAQYPEFGPFASTPRLWHEYMYPKLRPSIS